MADRPNDLKVFVNKADRDIINKWKVFWRSSSGKSLKTSLIAILAGIIFGFIILFVFHPLQSLSAIFEMILGPFRGGLRGFGDILYKAAPIILTGLSVGFAFKTGLFNIGAPGQFVVAGAVTVIVGQMTGINPNIHWIVALLAGTAAGAFWGLIPGLLKGFANVHEVVATIMMNYIGIHAASLIISRYAYRISGYASINQSALLPKWGLDVIFQHPPMIDISILIAIAMALIIWYVIDKTTFGFQLKAVGYNFEASRYAGINEKRNIVLSMVISGALAGIAGACLYLGGTKMTTAPILAGEGFAGITVALLASSNPIAIIFAGYFIAHISIGGSLIRVFGFQGEIASIVTASIVYFMGIGIMIQYFLTAIHRHREEKKKAKIKEGVH